MHRFYSDDKMLVGRDTFVVAFFTRDLYAEAAAPAREVFERWLSKLPKDTLQWAHIGPNSEEFRAFTPTLLGRARREFEASRAAKQELGFVQLCGGDESTNPAYSFLFHATNEPALPDESCLIEIRWPSEYPEQIGFDAFVESVREIASLLPYRSGYASPALSRGWENSKHLHEGGRQIVPLAFRHPGFDLPENDAACAFTPADACRGARWLSFLGPTLVEKLGGVEPLRAQLDPKVTTAPAGDGLMLRAGAQPEIGDVNRAILTPLLRSVARAIEPVTHFNDWKSLGALFDDDEERVALWERRHLD